VALGVPFDLTHVTTKQNRIDNRHSREKESGEFQHITDPKTFCNEPLLSGEMMKDANR
jgi:hypothetical protein